MGLLCPKGLSEYHFLEGSEMCTSKYTHLLTARAREPQPGGLCAAPRARWQGPWLGTQLASSPLGSLERGARGSNREPQVPAAQPRQASCGWPRQKPRRGLGTGRLCTQPAAHSGFGPPEGTAAPTVGVSVERKVRTPRVPLWWLWATFRPQLRVQFWAHRLNDAHLGLVRN